MVQGFEWLIILVSAAVPLAVVGALVWALVTIHKTNKTVGELKARVDRIAREMQRQNGR